MCSLSAIKYKIAIFRAFQGWNQTDYLGGVKSQFLCVKHGGILRDKFYHLSYNLIFLKPIYFGV